MRLQVGKPIGVKNPMVCVLLVVDGFAEKVKGQKRNGMRVGETRTANTNDFRRSA